MACHVSIPIHMLSSVVTIHVNPAMARHVPTMSNFYMHKFPNLGYSKSHDVKKKRAQHYH